MNTCVLRVNSLRLEKLTQFFSEAAELAFALIGFRTKQGCFVFYFN